MNWHRSGKLLIHLILWVLSYFLLFRIFTREYDSGAADHIYTLIFHVPLLIVVYLNVYIIHKFLLERKYWTYGAVLCILILVCLALYHLLFDIITLRFNIGYYFIAYYSSWEFVQFIFAYISCSFLISMSINYFNLRSNQQTVRIESQKAQLKHLKEQVNPHFLFNSLNNIYGTVDQDKEVAKKYVLKLSDALRYMIYDTDQELVPLAQEIEYIRDYIELEKLRFNNNSEIQYHDIGNFDQYVIAPLILTPIIENCFKHIDPNNIYVLINIKIMNEQLILESRNSFDQEKDCSNQGGLGLSNLRKRLELTYAENALLQTKTEGPYFIAKLVIKLDE